MAGSPDESVFQPHWSPDGRLWFVSDAPGYWNLHVLESDRPRCILREPAEHGMPLWQLGMSTFGFVPSLGQFIHTRWSREGGIILPHSS